MRLKMAQLGWPSDGEPVAMLMASHGELERELAAWKHEAKRLEDQLAKFDETAIEWWCEYQDLKAKARES
jgi:hypothetical protein